LGALWRILAQAKILGAFWRILAQAKILGALWRSLAQASEFSLKLKFWVLFRGF